MDNLLKPINTINKIEPGTIVRRIGKERDQQGSFLKYDGEHNMILANIIDMAEGSLVANEAVLKPRSGDKIFFYASSFDGSPSAGKALDIVKSWPFFKEHPDLQDKILSFVRVTFVPEQILEMSRKQTLQHLFVPIQQRLRVGRFREQRSPERVCNDLFMLWLESINEESHITYLAHIPHKKDEAVLFYSSGTRPHEETAKLLQKEIFTFDPTHGGHIQSSGVKKGKKHFNVDAGCNYLGLGVKTPLNVSKTVVAALKTLYSEFEFTPLKGCDARGE
ncbi:MAG: hypothetical protein E4G96_01375 [Chrysiogenales bacterium]|nr:MAG: hypothetical protein E4G96_01375 [Chrysiogenales bacterium]